MEIINDTDFFAQLAEYARQTDQREGNPDKEIRLLSDSLLLSAVLPGEPFDFRGGRTAALLSLLRKFGRASGAMGRLYEGHVNAIFLLHLHASEEQQAFFYGKVLHEQALMGVWNTDGRDPVVFRYNEAGAVVIQGSKSFCSGAGYVDYAIIGGRHQGKEGWQLVTVPMDKVDSGRIDRSSWETLGMKASNSYAIDFSGIHIPREYVLGKVDCYTAPPFFLGGAIRFAAVHQGMAEAIFQATLSYLLQRDRAEHPFQKMRLAEMEMAIRTGQLWLADGGKLFDRALANPERYGQQLASHANMARLQIEKIGLQIIELSAKCVGAAGLFSEIGIEQLHRDLAFYLRQPAPDETLQNAATFIVNTGTDIVDLYDSP